MLNAYNHILFFKKVPKIKNKVGTVAATILQVGIQKHRDLSSFSRVKLPISVTEFRFHYVTVSQWLLISPTNFNSNLTQIWKKLLGDAEIERRWIVLEHQFGETSPQGSIRLVNKDTIAEMALLNM